MKLNDAQQGIPETVYKDTKANIEALASPVEGMIAFATDTLEKKFGYYNGTIWVWSESGGASAFTDLSDVPADYTGDGGKFVRVNTGETALEFATLSGGGDVLGPATSTDGNLAVWDGTNSKTLKDGGAVPTGGGGSVLEVQVFS